MKNKHRENGVLIGPLILVAPASNLVAVPSLDWLDGCIWAAVSAKTHGGNYLANRPRNSERVRRDFGELGRASVRVPIMFESSLSIFPDHRS
jgi:hypothetical protein